MSRSNQLTFIVGILFAFSPGISIAAMPDECVLVDDRDCDDICACMNSCDTCSQNCTAHLAPEYGLAARNKSIASCGSNDYPGIIKVCIGTVFNGGAWGIDEDRCGDLQQPPISSCGCTDCVEWDFFLNGDAATLGDEGCEGQHVEITAVRAGNFTFGATFYDGICGAQELYDEELLLPFKVTCLDSIVLNDNIICPGESTTAQALGCVCDSEDYTVDWTYEIIDGDDLIIALDPTDCYCDIFAEQGSGTVKIIAYVGEDPICLKETTLKIGCETCSGGACGTGSGNMQNASVHASIQLGSATRGDSAGSLIIAGQHPSSNLSNPWGLDYNSSRDDVIVLLDGNEDIYQIKTPELLVHVEDDDPHEDGYEILFFHPEDVTNWPNTTGPWTVDLVDAFISWEISSSETNGYELEFTKSVDGSLVEVYTYAYDDAPATGDWEWVLTQEDSSYTTVRTESVVWNEDNSATDEWSRTRTITQDGGTWSKVVDTFTKTPALDRITERVVDPDGAALTTSYGYYDSGAAAGKRQFVVHPDGSWEYYTYYTTGDRTGRLHTVISSWGDYAPQNDDFESAAPTTLAQNAREIEYAYHATDLTEYRPISVTESIGGVVVSKTGYSYGLDAYNNPTVTESRYLNPGSTTNPFVTITTREPDNTTTSEKGRTLSVVYPDDRTVEYEYTDDGWYQHDGNGPGDFSDTEPGDPQGYFSGCTWTLIKEGTTSNPNGIVNKTTHTVHVTDAVGKLLLKESFVYTSSNNYATDTPISWTIYEYDDLGHLTDSYHSDGTHAQQGWDCCGLTSSTDRHGVCTDYLRDAQGRVYESTKDGVSVSGYPSQGDLYTLYEYDTETSPARRAVTTTVTNDPDNANSPELQAIAKYDLAGRIASQEDAAGLVTTYTYSTTAEGGRIVSIDRPGGDATEAEEITKYYRDGRIKSVTGCGVIAREYVYSVETNGKQTTTVYIGPSGVSSSRWEETTHDPLGRVTQEVRPGYSTASPPDVTTYYYYDDFGTGQGGSGRLIKTETVANSTYVQAPTVYEYDAMGNVVRTGMDMNNDGDLDLGGTDRITETESAYVSDSGWWLETITYTYLADNDTTATQTSEQRQRLSGYGTNVIAERQSVDAFDNVTTTTTTLERTNRLLTVTTDYHATDNDAVSVTINGLLQSITDKAQIETNYGYDTLGRQITVTDGRGNWTQTNYNANNGRVASINTKHLDESQQEVTDSTTTYSYYTAGSNIGRLYSVENTLGNSTYYEYSDRGETTKVWGDSPQPVYMGYDDFGQRVQLSTFRDDTFNWGGTTWPATVDPDDADDADITLWQYDEPTGLLKTKTYAYDTVDAKTVTYHYTPEGKLYIRISANNYPTIYYYDDEDEGSGQLVLVDYYNNSIDTDVSFTYDRSGQIKTVTDALGTRTFAYGANGTWRTELFDTNSPFPDVQVKQTYDDTVYYMQGFSMQSAHFQRLDKIEVGSTADPDELYRADYDYSADNDRMTKVTGPGVPSGGAYYDYLSGTHIPRRVRIKQGSTEVARIIRAYEEDRNLIDSVENQWRDGANVTTVSKYDYANDDLARRTGVVRSGEAFVDPSLPSNLLPQMDAWDYNDRNELTTSDGYANSDASELDPTTPDPSDSVSELDRAYSYDPIGNRKSYTEDTDTLYYCTNAFNQYTTTDNSDPLTPPATESFTYDNDGNLTADNNWAYTWDAECRLICMEPFSTPVSGDIKVEFKYDYMGRRVEKKVSSYNGSSWVVDDCRRFVYHGWQPLLEYEVDDPDEPTETSTILRKYTWGLDLSGNSIEGAGGIGGLLACYDTNGTTTGADPTSDDEEYIYFYDANGNVGQMIAWASGYGSATAYAWHDDRMVAKYEYDAYGNNILDPSNSVESGPCADDNPFRFSTKYWDDETGLGYWGYRYYSPRLGRWISRDPIGEKGELNLYIYAHNRSTDYTDLLGLLPKKCPPGEEAVSNGKTPTVNGCGSGSTYLIVPDEIGKADFTNACNNHDRCYAKCGKPKSECDDELVSDMKIECYTKFGWASIDPMPPELKIKLKACINIAKIYGLAVRKLGEKAHTETQEKFCKCCPKKKPTSQPTSQPSTQPSRCKCCPQKSPTPPPVKPPQTPQPYIQWLEF